MLLFCYLLASGL